MATWRDVLTKSKNLNLDVSSKHDETSNRVHYKFYLPMTNSKEDNWQPNFDRLGHVQHCVGARAALNWLKTYSPLLEQAV